MDEKLLTLPWQIQLALGSGYAAYMLAYLGIRSHHKPVDTAFRAIAFGLVAVAALQLLPADRPVYAGVLAFAAAIGGGAIWRLLGMKVIQLVARATNLSWADDAPSAWAALHSRSDWSVAQVAVLLEDGTWISCDDTTSCRRYPDGPFTLGTHGDVLLYPSHITRPGDERADVAETTMGQEPRVTWIPASQIKRVLLRYSRKPSRLSRLVAWVWKAFLGQSHLAPPAEHLPADREKVNREP